MFRSLKIHSQSVIGFGYDKGDNDDYNFFPLDAAVSARSFPFISAKNLYASDLADYYSSVSESSASKQRIVGAMAGFIPNLHDIELVIDPTLGAQIIVRLSDQDRSQPLAFFGDGSIKLVRILMQIPVTQDAHLMIDEIDAGIHYSRFATLWRTTLKAAIDNNVQLFITTHNVECLGRCGRSCMKTLS